MSLTKIRGSVWNASDNILQSTTVGSYQLSNSAGSITNPTYTFNGQTDTGILLGSPNSLEFAVGGVLSLSINSAGDINVQSNNIVGMADPIGAQDAATKNYVDLVVTSGTVWKDPIVDPDLYDILTAATGSPVAHVTYIAYGGTYPQTWGSITDVVEGDIITRNAANTDWVRIDTLSAGDRFIITGDHGTLLTTSALYSAGFRSQDLVQYVSGDPNTGSNWTIPHDAAYQVIDFTVAKQGSDSTGFTNDATVYVLDVTVDSTLYQIQVTGSAAQTFTNLITEINNDLTGATATLEPEGHIHITADNGIDKILIAEGTATGTGMLATLTNFDIIRAGLINGVTVVVNDPDSLHYQDTYHYNIQDNIFTLISGPNSIVAGTGLSKIGNTLNVNDAYILNTGDTFSGELLGSSGTVTNPTYSFSSDTDTGIWNVYPDNIGFTIGGSKSFAVNADSFYSDGIVGGANIKYSAGTSASPTYSFNGDADTGIFNSTTNTIAFTAGGTGRFVIDTTGFYSTTTGSANIKTAVGSATNPTYSFVGDPDTGFYSDAANTLQTAIGGVLKQLWNTNHLYGNIGGTYALYHGAAGSATNPTYTFNGDSDTGIFSDIADTLQFSVGASYTWYMNGGSMGSTTAGGPVLMDEAASATNPTLIPHKSYTVAGIGGGSNTVSIITDSVSRIYADATGNVGVGATSPLSKLHLIGTSVSLPLAAFTSDKLIIEDTDAVLGLYSSNGGSAGSEIVLGEIDLGALVNSWSLVRTTGTTPNLLFNFGTNANPFLNATRLSISSTGTLTTGGVILATAGSATAPSYSFTGDTDTGFYTPGVDTVRLSLGTSPIYEWATGSFFSNSSSTAFRISANAGSVTNPTYSFNGDPNTGIYTSGADNLDLVVGGTHSAMRINGSNLLSNAANGTYSIRHITAGSAATPTYSFNGDTDTGFYSDTVDTIRLSTNGIYRAAFGVTGFAGNNTGSAFILYGNGSATTPSFSFVGDQDTGIYSDVANTLQFSTGGTERVRISSIGNVGIGTTSPQIHTGTYGASAIYETLTGGTNAGVLEIGRSTNTNLFTVGGVEFFNNNNSDGALHTAGGKTVSAIRSSIVTSDVNAGQDSGGFLAFFTKPEAGTLAERFRINESGTLVGFSTGSAVIYSSTGSAATPTYSFVGDSDTGIYSDAAGQIKLSGNGVNSFIFTPTVFYAPVTGSFYMNRTAGSAAAPTYTFNGDEDTGIYNGNTNQINLATGGTSKVALSTVALLSSTTGSFYIPIADGANTAPTYSFNDDTDTGMYASGADELGFATAGVRRFSVSSNNIYSATTGSYVLQHAAGSAANPTYSFLGDLDTGIYSSIADNIEFSAGGVRRLRMSTTNLVSDTTGSVSISLAAGSASIPTYSFSGDGDTGMFSNSANLISFSAGGVQAVNIGSTIIYSATSTGSFRMPIAAGTAAAPTFSFTGDTDTGIWNISADAMGFATGGVEAMRINGSQQVSIGGTPDTKAILTLTSTTRGFLPPRMTTTQRDAIAGSPQPPEGLIIYNTTTSALNVFDGAWTALGAGSGTTEGFDIESTPGTAPSATGTDAVAIADGATAPGSEAIAIGVNATAKESSAIAIGHGAIASQTNGGSTQLYTVAIGRDAKAYESQGVAIGYLATAGVNAGSSDLGSVAIGRSALASGLQGVSIGYTSFASADYAVGIGFDAVANQERSVSLGPSANSKYGSTFTLKMTPETGGIEEQKVQVHLRIQTTDGTPTLLLGSNETGSYPMATGQVYYFNAVVIARAAGLDIAAYEFLGGVVENSAGTVTMKLAPTKNVLVEDVAAWDAAITANDTTNALDVTVTGAAATTINWFCEINMMAL